MSERRIIHVPVTLDSANRRKDRSVRLAATTSREIANDEFAVMDTFVGTTGWLVYAENELDDRDVPPEDAPALERRSKGQRMRAIWFLKWQRRGIEEPFDSWYDRLFERWMESWKEELS